jgi:hypothetical protein
MATKEKNARKAVLSDKPRRTASPCAEPEFADKCKPGRTSNDSSPKGNAKDVEHGAFRGAPLEIRSVSAAPVNAADQPITVRSLPGATPRAKGCSQAAEAVPHTANNSVADKLSTDRTELPDIRPLPTESTGVQDLKHLFVHRAPYEPRH